MTPLQEKTIRFIKGYYSALGYPPTLREIMRSFGHKSPYAVQVAVDALVAKGRLRRNAYSNRTLIPIP